MDSCFPEYVTYLGIEFEMTCTESGLFEVPNPTPFCRPPIVCLDPPEALNTTLLSRANEDVVREWTDVAYECEPGSKIPDSFTENVKDGQFLVQCGSKGKYPVSL